MRLIAILVAALGVSVAGFFGFVILASESDEVITIRTQDGTSGWHSTRLWVVDHAGTEWTRTGHPEKGWFVRLSANPILELERGDAVSPRRAVPVTDPDVARAVNDAFREKYGIADRIVALSGDATRRVVIRLDAIEP